MNGWPLAQVRALTKNEYAEVVTWLTEQDERMREPVEAAG
jgi:hypothetical protein